MNKNEWISAKIAKLVGEGKPQQQAIAIAYSMWEQGSKKQEGGDTNSPQSEEYFKNLQAILSNYSPALQPLPMAQEAIVRPRRMDGSNNMYARGESYNIYGETINPLIGAGNTPFNSQNYGVPVTNPFDSTQKGFYPAQGNTFPNSLTYGKPSNPNYGKAVTTTNNNPNWGKPVSSVNTPPTTGVASPTWNQATSSQQKLPKVVVDTSKKEAVATATSVDGTPTVSAVSELKPVGFTYGTTEQQLQASSKKAVDNLQSTGVIGGTEENKNPEMDWVKYNILNPYGQGMDLNTSLAYTGQQFAKGNTGMGIAGAGLSALKGVKSFLSGYSSGKGQKTLEQQMYDRLYNNDENLYRRTDTYQQGGEITNADLLTGNYITQDGQQNPNIEIEGGEYVKNSQTREVQEAVGEKHTEGGISVNLPDQSKVLSDYTKIGSGNVKTFEETFGIKLKASDTFATVLDKYNNKIGVKKLEEEEKELIKKVEKNAKSSIDTKTKQINEDFLAQEIADINNKKEELNKVKAEAFEAIFKEQEKIPKKGDGTQILDKSGKPMAQQGGVVDDNIRALAQQYGTSPEHILQILQEGNMKQEGGEQQGQAQGQPDPQQIIQAYAQMAGEDPNQLMQQLQQMQPEQQQAALQQMMAAIQQGQQSGQEQQQALQEGGEGGGGVSQEQVAQALQQGADPNQVIEQLIQSGVSHEEAMSIVGSIVQQMQQQQQPQGMMQQQQPMMQEGSYTKAQQVERLNDYYKHVGGLGYEGKKEIGAMQDWMAENYPQQVADYFTKNGQPLTAKHVDIIKDKYKNIFKDTGISANKKSEDYTAEEKLKLQTALGDKADQNFLLSGFKDNKWDWRFPMVSNAPQTKGVVKGVMPQIVAPNMNKFATAPETAVVDTPVDVKTEKTTSKEPLRNIISTEGLPYIMPPSAPLAPYLQQASLSRLEGQKGSVENQLQNSANSRQAAYESTRGLPPAQAAAMIANYLSTSGQQDTAGIAQQEMQDLQNKARIEQYNAGQADKEQLLNEQLKKQYEREAFGTLNVNEQNWRNYYDANQANQKALSDKIERRNIMNLGLTNYQLNGSGGFDFVNQSPFQNNTGDSNSVTDYSPENIKKWKDYLKNIEAQAQLSKKDK